MTPALSRLKKPFGTAKMVDLTAARYLAWEDTFEVDFADGLTFLEPHSSIRKANHIAPKAVVERVEMDAEFHEGFFVTTITARRRKSHGRSSVSCLPKRVNSWNEPGSVHVATQVRSPTMAAGKT
jgi:hypothetical protein